MSAALKIQNRITPQEYLSGESLSPMRHEYVDGLVYAMAGTSAGHNRRIKRVEALLRAAKGGKPCSMFTENLKVRVDKSNSYYYPGLILTCTPVADDATVIDAPCLIVEVTSPSTEATDRREKLLAYQSLSTLTDYWIVNPAEPAIEAWRRTPQGWAVQQLTAGDALWAECLQAEMALDAVYAAESP